MADEKQAKLQQLQSQVRQLMADDAIAEHEHRLSPAQRFVHFWILAGRNFLKNRGPARAASLAYTTLLALVPMLAVSISVLSLFLPRDEAEQKEKLVGYINLAVEKFAPSVGVTPDFQAAGITNSLPRNGTNGVPSGLTAEEQRAQLADKIVEFVGNIRFGTIGATAMAGLIFIAISLLRNIEAGFNDMWGVTQGRGWVMSIVIYWTVITLGPVVVVVAKGSSYYQVLIKVTNMETDEGGERQGTRSPQPLGTDRMTIARQGTNSPAGRGTPNSHAHWTRWVPSGILLSVAWVPALGFTSMAFGALYLWMPNTRVRWSAAMVGGFVAASLWMLNGRMAALYNTRVLTNHAIYGSLGVLPLFLFGLYLSWMILLFGAQVAYVFQFRKAYLQERRAGQVNQQAREFIALRFMAEIGRLFQDQAMPLTATSCAEKFGVPPKLTKDILTLLVNGRLLAETTGSDTAYTPARPLDQISVKDVLRTIRAGSGSDLSTHDDAARSVVRGEFEAVLAAEESRAGKVSIRELIARIQAPKAAS
jgi:membrane protein